MQVDEYESFAAMRLFLEEYYDRTDGQLATLLADLEIQADGEPNDPAAWSDWVRCLKAVVSPRRSV